MASAAALSLLAGCATVPADGLAPGVDATRKAPSSSGPERTSQAFSASAAASAASPSASANASSGIASGSSASGGPPAPPSFDTVIKGAERQGGLLPVWRRQDKVWIELEPRAFNKPLFLSPRLATGIGEAGIYGGLLQSRWAQVGRPQWVEFRKVQQQVQLVAVNATYTALSGTPQALAVASAFSPSLVASVPVASSPQAGSGAVLIDASALMLSDILGMAQHLQRHYRQSYSLDSRNSVLLKVGAQDTGMVFEVSQHFATSGISAGGGASGTPPSTIPLSVPDPRSLFVTVHYTLTPLPDQPMPTRPADARVGYFATTVADFTNDLARTPRVRFINRWRLEKKEPDAPLSETRQPLVYWLDPSIPEAYRATIRDGVLEWNKAFEAIGFKNAIQVRMPASEQAFEALRLGGQASIRWMTNSQPGFGAIGPTHVDPRTGEILHAHIALESLSSRAMRTARSQFLHITPPTPDRHAGDRHDHQPGGVMPHSDAPGALPPDACQHGLHASEQLSLAMDVLEARGQLDPDSPDVQTFVLAYLKDTTMHEVGHTLGLRHNFKASMWRSAQELSDPLLGRDKGNSASVMDYAPINLPGPGLPAGAPFQTTLGPYDFWAIEYGYRPLPADGEQARSILRDIAQRSSDPAWQDALAYGTDEDHMEGLDPQALVFDLGRDPIAHARTRLATVRELFERQAARQLKPDEDPSLPRRSVSFGLREMARVGQILLRQIGGVVIRRDGAGSGRDLLSPLPAPLQRNALQLLTKAYLSPDAAWLPPALQRRLAPDFMDRQDNGDSGLVSASTNFSWSDQQLALQRMVLGVLMNENLSERLIDNADKTQDIERRPLMPEEVLQGLRQTIWTDRALPPAQNSARRNLQREHVNRLAAAIVRNGSDRADVRALMRDEARQVLKLLQARGPRGGGSGRLDMAHRQDCIDTLTTALGAAVVRMAP